MESNTEQQSSGLIPDEVYNTLPDILQDITNQYADRKRDIMLLSSLGALSCCLPNIKGLYGEEEVFSNLFFMCIAPAGSGKGVMNHARKLVEKIHKTAFEESIELRKQKSTNSSENQNIPPIKTKIIPANISTSEMYNMINNAPNGSLIIESEADTLSSMMKNEWGNFSDVLRKAFHHEALSLSRKTNSEYIEIPNPQLSIVLSGTPGQIKSLIDSKENGLFSRFCFYYFEEESSWFDPFESKVDKKIKIQEIGDTQIFELYNNLLERNNPLIFQLSSDQKSQFNKELQKALEGVMKSENPMFSSAVKRHGLICFRICMILSAIRNAHNIKELDTLDCSDQDFETALTICFESLEHSLKVFQSMDNTSMTNNDKDLLSQLDDEFSTNDAMEKGKEYDLSERSIYNKLNLWVDDGLIQKQSRGVYIKINKE